MTHVIFDLCIRDGACAEVCPVECIIPGQPEEEWPWYYIDPDTCIDCGACVPECPVDAILPEEDLPEEYQYTTELNALYFTEGPGYRLSRPAVCAPVDLSRIITVNSTVSITSALARRFFLPRVEEPMTEQRTCYSPIGRT